MTPPGARDQDPVARDVRPTGRDRDPVGRPRNARPRDGLGRPLPRGVEGEARVPDDLLLPPDESLALADRLLNEGRPFHAHEVLEASWKAAPAEERDFWQGLAQLAVGLTHARRGNAAGAVTLLRRAAARIRPCAPADPHGVPVTQLANAAEALAAQIDRAGLDTLPPSALDLPLRPGSGTEEG
jgi:hypothetical protein